MPDDQAEIPQRVEQLADEPLVAGTDRAVEHYQNIDVRVKTEVSTAVPAECENGGRVLGARCLGVQPLQQRVDAPRVSLHGQASALPTNRLVAQLAARLVEQRRQRRLAIATVRGFHARQMIPKTTSTRRFRRR